MPEPHVRALPNTYFALRRRVVGNRIIKVMTRAVQDDRAWVVVLGGPAPLSSQRMPLNNAVFLANRYASYIRRKMLVAAIEHTLMIGPMRERGVADQLADLAELYEKQGRELEAGHA